MEGSTWDYSSDYPRVSGGKTTGILLQEEERRKNLKPQNSDLALVAKKKFFKGKQGGANKGVSSSQKRPFSKSNQEMDDVNTWLVEFGASIHMTYNMSWNDNFKEVCNGANIYLGDDAYIILRDVGIFL